MGQSKEEKRRAEKQAEREREAKERAEERRAEQEREKAKEEERRQESIRTARELDALLAAAQQRALAARDRSRLRRKHEREASVKADAQRAAILDSLRALNQQERKAEAKSAEEKTTRNRSEKQKPERPKPERPKPERPKPERPKAVRAKPEPAKPKRAKPERAKPEREKPERDKPERPTPERAKAERPKPERAKPEREKPEREKPEREKPEREKPARAKAERPKPERPKPEREKPERPKPERTKAERPKPEREKPERPKPEREKPERTKPKAAKPKPAKRDDPAAERAAASRAQRQADKRAVARESDRNASAAAARGESRATDAAASRAAAGIAEREASSEADSGGRPARARIISGALSGELPWLRVSGQRLVDAGGAPVLLRGVNLFGMDDTPPDPGEGYAEAAGITESVIDAIAGWGANVIRVAINRDWVLHGHDDASVAYVSDLDRIIERASGAGMYTMLSLRRLDAVTSFGTTLEADGTTSTNFIAPQPDYDSIGMWRVLGERYADESAVLFDLYTAPHRALPDDLSGYDTGWDMWSVWVRLMVADLRRMHPRALCVVAGLDWGVDLSGFPVRGTAGEPIPNLIFAARAVQGRPAPWTALDALSRHHPVFVTEWSGAPAEALWGEQAALRLRAGGMGWAAADWKTLQTPAGAPTKLGSVVQRALALAEQQRRERLVPGAAPLLSPSW